MILEYDKSRLRVSRKVIMSVIVRFGIDIDLAPEKADFAKRALFQKFTVIAHQIGDGLLSATVIGELSDWLTLSQDDMKTCIQEGFVPFSAVDRALRVKKAIVEWAKLHEMICERIETYFLTN